ncbi:hypothetical protein L208DRAFT_1393931 [Tricholoma matsutake]|nr:hypothetical protein L208DRAFT_1393931 [Tricholoma matsutake 945]
MLQIVRTRISNASDLIMPSLQRAKEKELQRLSDLSVALGFLCEHFITSACLFDIPKVCL